MKNKFYKTCMLLIISTSSIGAPTIASADSIEHTHISAEISNEIPAFDLSQIQTRVRGTVGNQGKRPKIYVNRLNASQRKCVREVYGNSGLALLGGNLWVVAGTALWNIYSHCR